MTPQSSGANPGVGPVASESSIAIGLWHGSGGHASPKRRRLAVEARRWTDPGAEPCLEFGSTAERPRKRSLTVDWVFGVP